MNTTRRLEAALDADKRKIPGVLVRANAIHTGMDADHATYAAPNPPLSAFLLLIQNLATAQGLVPSRTRGMAAARNVQRDLLWTGMETQRMYVQTLADNSPSRAVSIIQNAGMVVAGLPLGSKPVLALTLGTQPGSVDCAANVGLLIGTGASKPTQLRFFNWQYTLDGKTFVTAPPTTTWRTTLTGLPPLTVVGVRVNLNNAKGPGPWSQVVTIVVH